MNRTISLSARYFVSIVFFCVFTNLLHSNSIHPVDSLKAILSPLKDTARVNGLIDISYALENSDLNQGVELAREAISIAQQLNYEKGLGNAYYVCGYLYHLKEDHQNAEEMYNHSVSIFQKLKQAKKLSEAYGRLGHLYTLRAEYGRSIEIYQKALEITKRTKDDRNASIIIFSMANSYAYLGETQKAFKLMTECKNLISHRPHLINYYAILADLYRGTGDHEKSLENFFHSMEICEEFRDTLRMAYISQGIARTYSELGQYKKSAAFYFQTMDFNEIIGSPILTIVSYLGLGELNLLSKSQSRFGLIDQFET